MSDVLEPPPIFREIVEAGAGCGKTTRLVSRYLEALGLRADGHYRARFHPNQVIALTFTEEAAAQMKARVLVKLASLGHPELQSGVLEFSQISTFHSLCYRLLRPHLSSLGYAEGSRIVSGPVAEARRSRFVLQFAARFNERAQLLSHLGERELIESVLRLWFSKNIGEPAAPAVPAKDPLARFLKTIAWAREELLIAQAEFPAEFASEKPSWLGVLQQRLASVEGLPEDLRRLGGAELNFQRGSKAAKERFADLYSFARSFRDATELKLHLAALAESLREDAQTQALLLRFARECRERGPKILDFAALEYELSELLLRRGRDDLGLKAPKVILVDEFQDTNRTQFSIIQALSAEDTEWFFVGDPKQSIYQFRGADVSLFMDLCTQLEKTELSTNYRTDAGTLDWINALQAQLFVLRGSPHDPAPQHLASGKILEPGALAPASPSVTLTWSDSRKEKFFSVLLQDLRPRLAEPGESAVLFLSWKRLFEFSQFLKEQNVPFSISGSPHSLDHLLSAVFADFLEWIAEPTSTSGLASFLRWTENYEGLLDLRALIPAIPPRVLDEEAAQALKHRWGVADDDLSLEQLLYRFCQRIDPTRFVGGRDWAAAMEVFLGELHEQRLEQYFSAADVARFIRRYAAQSEAQSPLQSAAGDSAVGPLRLLTVHGSKGLEFDHVFLPEMYARKPTHATNTTGGEDDASAVTFNLDFFDRELECRRPSILFLLAKREQAAKLESERRRLFYVAVTRSKQTLHLYAQQPAKAATTTDPLSDFFGAPPVPTAFWNQTLLALAPGHPHVITANLDVPESAEKETRKAQLERELWSFPARAAIQTDQAPRAELFRGGVRDYLKRGETPLASAYTRSTAPGSARDAAVRALHQADRGKTLHRLLEIWSGRPETLEGLLAEVPEAPLMRSALEALRELPALQSYWTAAERRDPSLYREMELLIHLTDARLTGVADALLWESDNSCVLIDWKTGSELATLSNRERIESLTQQLSLYAQAFPGWRIRGLGVGVEWPKEPGARARANVIFEGSLT